MWRLTPKPGLPVGCPHCFVWHRLWVRERCEHVHTCWWAMCVRPINVSCVPLASTVCPASYAVAKSHVSIFFKRLICAHAGPHPFLCVLNAVPEQMHMCCVRWQEPVSRFWSRTQDAVQMCCNSPVVRSSHGRVNGCQIFWNASIREMLVKKY